MLRDSIEAATVDLQEISQRFKRDDLSPEELSTLQMKLAGEYGIITLKLIKILEIKADVMPRLINRSRTYNEAERTWELTGPAKEEQRCKLQLDVIEAQLRAINTRLKMLAIRSLTSGEIAAIR